MKDLATHILDIAENAVNAGSGNVWIHVLNAQKESKYGIVIQDDGSGMDEATLCRATDPYFTSRKTRKVGMGLPLFKQNAERTDGCCNLYSEPGKGTKVEAVFNTHHLDCPPEGDLADIFVFLLFSHPSIDFTMEYRTDNGEYKISSKEIREVLGETPISHSEIRNYLHEMIGENVKDLIMNDI